MLNQQQFNAFLLRRQEERYMLFIEECYCNIEV